MIRPKQVPLIFGIIALTTPRYSVAARPTTFLAFVQPPLSLKGRIRRHEGNPKNSNGGNAKQTKTTPSRSPAPSGRYTTRWPLSFFGYANLSPFGLILLASALQLSYKHFQDIPKQHFAFATLYPLYLGLVNRFRFQCNQPALSRKDPRVITNTKLLWQEQGAWFPRYLCTFGVAGLVLPCLFCWLAPTVIAQPAVSHTVLILAQVVTEELSQGPWMHMFPALLVPIGFNAYRMGSLAQWVQDSWGLVNQRTNIWTVLGLSLGVVNLTVWAYNLFVFLLLRVTPQYWDIATFPVSKVQWKGQLWPVAEA